MNFITTWLPTAKMVTAITDYCTIDTNYQVIFATPRIATD
jgi:hypothetical protein